MDRNRVLAALETLNSELADADQVNPEAREQLARLSAQVRDAVAAGEHDAAATQDRQQLSGLQEALVEFETEHPQLAGAINQVATALAALGI